MVANHKLDFETEYAKLKEMLRLFEGVIQKKKKKKELDKVKTSLASKHTFVTNLADILEGTKMSINNIKENIRLRKQDYDTRGSEWQNRHRVVAFNPEWPRCNTMPNTDLEEEDIPAIELLIQGTKEKVALLEEKLSIAQQSLECKDLEKQFESQTLDLEKEENLEVAEKVWARRWSEYLSNMVSDDHKNVNDTIADDSTVPHPTVADLQSNLKIAQEIVRQLAQKLTSQRNNPLPLVTIGFHIRARKLERVEDVRGSAQNQVVIEFGGQSSILFALKSGNGKTRI